jgi:hypothetical protein
VTVSRRLLPLLVVVAVLAGIALGVQLYGFFGG